MNTDPKRRAIVEILETVSEHRKSNRPADYHNEDLILLQVAQVQAQLLLVDTLKELMEDAHESESLHNRIRKVRARPSRD